jgi:hypothetical protein
MLKKKESCLLVELALRNKKRLDKDEPFGLKYFPGYKNLLHAPTP